MNSLGRTTLCVGCSALVPEGDGPIHRYMTSAPACWARYGELLGVLSVAPSLQAARQMCVDAYAAQHPGAPNPQAIQSVAVHLLNLYEYLVRGRPAGIPRFAGHKGAFRWLEPPSFAGTLTVFDMPAAGPENATAQSARAWAEAVWGAWSAHHAQIASWHAEHARS